MPGLLDFALGDAALLQNPLFQTGLGLLERSGATRFPTGFGANLGGAIGGATNRAIQSEALQQARSNLAMSRQRHQFELEQARVRLRSQQEARARRAQAQRLVQATIQSLPLDPQSASILNTIAQVNPEAALQQVSGLLAPPEADPFTLSAGQTRFDAAGNIIAEVERAPTNEDRVLVEVFDETSPTGTRFVTRADAVGQPGKPPTGMSVEVGPDGTVRLLQGRSSTQRRKPPSPADAAKIQSLRGAAEDLTEARSILLNDDGAVNRRALVTGRAGIPGASRKARRLISRALEARIRAISGAEVPQAELERQQRQFMPAVSDSDEEVLDKLSAAERFISGATALIEGVEPSDIDAMHIDQVLVLDPDELDDEQKAALDRRLAAEGF